MSLKKFLPLFIITPLILALDQFSKLWVVNNLELGETLVIDPALQPFLQITRTTNTGIAFGIGAGGGQIFLVLSIIVTIVLVVMYLQSESAARLQQIALSIVIAGALGNIIDRARLGHVIDFVHVEIPNAISNVSNFADHAVVIGVIVLLIDGFLSERRAHQQQAHHISDETIAIIEENA